jgi:hypothetical protein
MATQILRTVDRWRFETPLALTLAAAAGFAVMAMPHAVFAQLPVAGRLGMPAHIGLAALLALVCGVAAYVAMRRPAKAVPVDEDVDPMDDIDVPSGLSEDRLLRLRRADRHPDAPPRAPIRASRDLGEPFMDVGAFVPSVESESETDSADEVAADPAIIDGEYVEVDEIHLASEPLTAEPEIEHVAEAAPAEVDDVGTPLVDQDVEEEAPVTAAPVVDVPAPVVPPVIAPAPRQDSSIAAMMDRLSAGMERRAARPAMPARDMRPALRDALDELNRLAARRG